MSWVQRAPLVRGPGEEGDVFDEEADESLLVQREWRSHMQRRVKEGYRDGIDAGKAVTLQQGFNQGYKEGAEIIINYGQLRGTLRDLVNSPKLGRGKKNHSYPTYYPSGTGVSSVSFLAISFLLKEKASPLIPRLTLQPQDQESHAPPLTAPARHPDPSSPLQRHLLLVGQSLTHPPVIVTHAVP
ncbi:protein YAE1 homolog isoform X3 [Canis lupus baileyi]|uniref:protein YAE1 homolog isoform X3 n=1 Tax=Canis lupus familiaris TaxID=9615 RepID=UPI0006B3D8C3|nr:protein YAE1 homolog isoform X3 [Canis lupus familiaris]XP_025305093.1 protein YAE1 homolog isoform X3 [Canis lupus dingo]XP_038279648.1 protein YAE1 homolog isoform X3 [Canis lupus familiaris]XP_038418595.1 protein YAE1 homolog isoform X3 [Canis lupus familiaris]|eukprot:XP_013976307.1 yae1 domain-containing protein 1 isoform X3 [Canis lupus familiaris]